jgi:hypothetical protein
VILSAAMNGVRHGAIFAATAMLLFGCGHSPQSAAPTHLSAAPKKKPVNGVDPDMVSAVSLGGASSGPISMKFKLAARPQVTAPLQITLVIIPANDAQINRVQLAIQPGDGLQLQSDRTTDLADLKPGVPVQQTLTVIPQQSGLLYLNATVLVDSDSQSVTRTYAVPLIAIDGHG